MTNEHADLLVIGASAAGLKCAARFRRLRPQASIIVLDAAKDISVGACGLPYVVSGDIDDADALRKTAFDVLRDEDFFATYKDIDVRTEARALAIDVDARTVTTRVGQREGEISYGELMVATGAEPKVPAGLPPLTDRLRAVKRMDDAWGIRALLETGKVERVAIVGAGFIGCEMAEAFGAMWGCAVTLVEAASQVLPGMLDPEMAAVVESELREQSVDVWTSTVVRGLREADRVRVFLEGSEDIEADLVVVSVGVAPQVGLARAAGIEVGPAGGIVVDERMRTSAAHVYAAGDCVECVSAVTGQKRLYALGSLANRQGRVAADAMAGRESRFGPVTGSTIVKVFDLNASATGLTQGEAERVGLDVQAVWGTFGDRAHYYPEEQRLFAKLVYERGSGRVVGLQVVGKGDVARPVDVLSTVLQRGGTVEALLDLEFAYAPPFAAALDPLHHLGAMAVARRSDGVEPVGPMEDLGESACIDIRLPEEADAAPWPGPSVRMPMAEIRTRAKEVPPGDIVVLCEKGPRSFEVARWLKEGRTGEVRYLAGGRSLWQRDMR